jgi:hypothetical protein
MEKPSSQQSQNQKNELMDLAGLLADLKRKWPDIYRHIMGIIKNLQQK